MVDSRPEVTSEVGLLDNEHGRQELTRLRFLRRSGCKRGWPTYARSRRSRERDIEDAHFLADSEFRRNHHPHQQPPSAPVFGGLLTATAPPTSTFCRTRARKGAAGHSCVRVESGSSIPLPGAPLNEYSEFQLKPVPFRCHFGGDCGFFRAFWGSVPQRSKCARSRETLIVRMVAQRIRTRVFIRHALS